MWLVRDSSWLLVVDWGRTQYLDALARQKAWVARRKAGMVPDSLILTEHQPVYTIGVRPNAASHLMWNRARLESEGIAVVATNRGGDITYHGPGQVVGYPIVDWQNVKDLHRYLRLLEEVLIRSAATWGLSAERREGMTGIWIGRRKLAAIGVAVKSWITYHGFALNVDPQLNHFSGIIPCGIGDAEVTSLKRELGGAMPELDEVKQRLSLEFETIFAEALCYGNAQT